MVAEPESKSKEFSTSIPFSLVNGFPPELTWLILLDLLSFANLFDTEDWINRLNPNYRITSKELKNFLNLRLVSKYFDTQVIAIIKFLFFVFDEQKNIISDKNIIFDKDSQELKKLKNDAFKLNEDILNLIEKKLASNIKMVNDKSIKKLKKKCLSTNHPDYSNKFIRNLIKNSLTESLTEDLPLALTDPNYQQQFIEETLNYFYDTFCIPNFIPREYVKKIIQSYLPEDTKQEIVVDYQAVITEVIEDLSKEVIMSKDSLLGKLILKTAGEEVAKSIIEEFEAKKQQEIREKSEEVENLSKASVERAQINRKLSPFPIILSIIDVASCGLAISMFVLAIKFYLEHTKSSENNQDSPYDSSFPDNSVDEAKRNADMNNFIALISLGITAAVVACYASVFLFCTLRKCSNNRTEIRKNRVKIENNQARLEALGHPMPDQNNNKSSLKRLGLPSIFSIFSNKSEEKRPLLPRTTQDVAQGLLQNNTSINNSL